MGYSNPWNGGRLVKGRVERGFIVSTIFGPRLAGVRYAERPAAYAVVGGGNGTVAAVRGPSGRMWLPGGGSLPGETPEEALVREVREELARGVLLLRWIGEATQFFYAADEGCHCEMRAVFFLAEFPDEPNGEGEHELVWLPLADATGAFLHECHAWAVCRGLGASPEGAAT